MTRASRRGRTLRAPRAPGKVVYFILTAVLLLVVAFGLAWGVPKLVRFVGAVGQVGQVFTTPVPMTTPGVTPQPTPDPINKPFTVLLLGVDRRGEGEGGTRSDVNIVVYVDPVRRFASMLSIPRDTRVYIPGFGSEKINAAYSLGGRYMADAGGGPALAKRTAAEFLAMPIDYYAEIDFQGFERIVDLLGGVTIDVPAPLEDNEYPTADYGYTRIYIPAGLQHMDGRTALQYARSRHADNDIGRNRRQQQVLLALRDRILRMDTLTDIDRMTDLLNQLSDSLRTDIQPGDLFSMLQLAPQIEPGRITSYTLDWHVLTEVSGPIFYFEPCLPCVQEIASQMRLDPLLQRLRAEDAQVAVQNGTDKPGLARRTADYLYGQGFANDQLAVFDADRSTYTQTLLYDSGPYTFTRDLLVELLDIAPANVHLVGPGQVPNQPYAGIGIILGNDFTEPQQ